MPSPQRIQRETSRAPARGLAGATPPARGGGRRYARAAARLLAATAAVAVISAAEGETIEQREAVVIASTAPGYAPGDLVRDDFRVALPSGTTLAVLLRSGAMLRLKGPFEGALGPDAPQASGAGLAERLRLSGVDVAVIGGGRALTEPAAPQREIRIDAASSATYCVVPSSTLWLTRPPGTAADDQLALRRRGAQREIGWPAGATQVEWPLDLPIEDGDRFELVDVARDAVIVTIEFRRLRPAPDSTAAAALALSLAGCRSQAAGEIDRLRRAAVPPELALVPGPAVDAQGASSLVATAQTTHDGYLYCIVAREDGSARRAHPKAGELARVRAGIPIPILRGAWGDTGHGGGPGTLRCFFSQQELGRQLPPDFFETTGSLATDVAAGTIRGLEDARAAGSAMSVVVQLRE